MGSRWNGHSACEVLRYLGSQGLGTFAARKIMLTLHLEPEDQTLKIQLAVGRTGKGPVSKLGPADRQYLDDLLAGYARNAPAAEMPQASSALPAPRKRLSVAGIAEQARPSLSASNRMDEPTYLSLRPGDRVTHRRSGEVYEVTASPGTDGPEAWARVLGRVSPFKCQPLYRTDLKPGRVRARVMLKE